MWGLGGAGAIFFYEGKEPFFNLGFGGSSKGILFLISRCAFEGNEAIAIAEKGRSWDGT